MPSCLLPAFTLIELLAVVTLLSLFVAATALQLDGVSAGGRLRSSARQIAALHRTARIETLAGGQPRRLVFESGPARCLIQRPEREGRRWIWSGGQSFPLIEGVNLDCVLTDDRLGEAEPESPWSVRIDSDGVSPSYECTLKVAGQAVSLFVDGRTGIARILDQPDLQSLEQDSPDGLGQAR